MPSVSTFRLAAVQAAPILFDKAKTTAKAVKLIAEAGRKGAQLAVFGETFLPGYPFFVDAGVDGRQFAANADYLDNAVHIGGPETDALCAAARKSGIDVVIGVAEKDPLTDGTAYCTALTIGREGVILNRHRKLKPTHAERMIWGDGDAAGLRTVERPYGRLSALNCWEHQMLLPAYALAAQGTQIHAALWPGRELAEVGAEEYCWTRQLLLSRAFASQTAAYVVAAAGLRLKEHVPPRWQGFGDAEHNGRSVIIDPRGEVIAGPLEGEGILLAEGSLSVVRAAKAACDIAGHYSRPDIFDFRVNDAPAERAGFASDASFDDDDLEEIFGAFEEDAESDDRDPEDAPRRRR